MAFHKRKKNMGLYMKNVITRKIKLPFKIVGNNIQEIIHHTLKNKLEGKCIKEGFIKPNSIQILNYSAGIIDGNNVLFEVMMECLVCRPVEGMKIRCVIKNITKAGIRAEIASQPSPVIIFIARDHNYQSNYFSSRKEGEEISVRVIGQRFELNDKYISIIAMILEPRKKKLKKKIIN